MQPFSAAYLCSPSSSRGEQEWRSHLVLGEGFTTPHPPPFWISLGLAFGLGCIFTSSIFEACSYLKTWLKFAKKLEVIEGWKDGQGKCLISFSQEMRLKKKELILFLGAVYCSLDR